MSMATSTKKSRKTRGEATLGISDKAFDQAVADDPQGRFMLALYISGMTPLSRRAIDNIQTLCKEHLAGRYELKIIDICQEPGLAKEAQIIALPTLIKKRPLPMRRLIGDLSDPKRFLLALGLVQGSSGTQ